MEQSVARSPRLVPGTDARRAWMDREWLQRTGGPVIVLAVLIVTFTILSSSFLTADNAVNILRQSSVLMVLALAGTFVILMGSIDLSVGSTVTLAGCIGALLVRDSGEGWVLLVPIIGLLAGLVNGILFAYVGLPSFLVTLGTFFAFNGLALYLIDGTPVPVASDEGIGALFSGNVVGDIPAVAVWALAALLVCMFVAKYTRFGRFMYAIGGGEPVARLSGVPVRRYKLYAFVVAGLLASIGGIMLLFRVGAGTPDMGGPFLLPAIAAVVMGGTALTGGIGGPHRTFLGVLVLAILVNGMQVAEVHPFLQVVVQGVAVIVAVALTMDRTKLSLVK